VIYDGTKAVLVRLAGVAADLVIARAGRPIRGEVGAILAPWVEMHTSRQGE